MKDCMKGMKLILVNFCRITSYREHPPPPPPSASTSKRPSSPPPKPPGKKTPAPPPPSQEYEERDEVIRDHSDLEQSDQEHSVKITIEETPEDSDEDDFNDKPLDQVVTKSKDPLEAGYQRSMKRLLSNITEIPDDECDEDEITMEFPKDKDGETSEIEDKQERYKVYTDEQQDVEEETEAGNSMSFIDSAFTLNEIELNDDNSEPEKMTPKVQPPYCKMFDIMIFTFSSSFFCLLHRV